jgi:exosortase F-associated protein
MKAATLKLRPRFCLRCCLFLIGTAILAAVYIFQGINPSAILRDFHPNAVFIVNRIIRLILNDLACFLIILALFRERKYLILAFWVFLLELLLILPLYLALKLALEGPSEISSPLLSHIHRLIVNPMLMILLIAGFFYQRFLGRQRQTGS